MTPATLRPAPFAIPPAPVARSRAATVSVIRSYDRRLYGIAGRSDQMTTHQVPPADTAADVFGGGAGGAVCMEGAGVTDPTTADIVTRMTNYFEGQCAERGHFWARYSPTEHYCQACGLRRPIAEETA